MAICKKWEVTATVIGQVTDGKNLLITYNGELIVDVPPRTVAHDGPVYQRPISEPKYLAELKPVVGLPNLSTAAEIRSALIKLLSSPNIADKSWVTSQYDKYVQGNTVLAQPEDAGMVRIDEESNLGIAISTDCNSRYVYLNPYNGVQQAVAESCRNIAVAGARPLALTNCLNFGSPEDPEVMWQFKEAVTGLADLAQAMGLPVTGGNVSFYNQTGSQAILPTPVIGTLGVISDVTKRTKAEFQSLGAKLILVGKTDNDFSGSEWAALHGQIGNKTPAVDYPQLKNEMNFLLEIQGKVESAHDLSNGGLAAALIEAAISKNFGASLDLTLVNSDLSAALFAETPGRTLLSVKMEQLGEIEKIAEIYGQTISCIGEVTNGEFEINNEKISKEELFSAFKNGLTKIFGSVN
jgi:phosphoribosylformylglycinamidine synthase subunit PurL